MPVVLSQGYKKAQKKEDRDFLQKQLQKALIYEKRFGKPIYYKGYEEVLKGKLPLEAVMGSSLLHAFLIDLIVTFLKKFLKSQKYIVLYGEVGFKFAKSSWYNIDIGIWEKEKVKSQLFEDKMTTIAPKVVIEIDTKADVKKFGSFEEYVNIKIKDLLESGVEKVVWIFTTSKKILVAEKDKDWIITDWNKEISILEGVQINLEKLVNEVK